jgi:putative ABC transport system permease protein
MLRALDRKVLRDLWRLKGQAIAIGAVMAAGVAMLLAYISTFDSLQLTQRTYYERYRFADVFASLKRAPLSLLDRLTDVPGVSLVETRVVADVILDIEGMQEPAIGRLVSAPVPRRAMLNDLFLRRSSTRASPSLTACSPTTRSGPSSTGGAARCASWASCSHRSTSIRFVPAR